MTDKIIAVLGLGYVGLPLAVTFGQRMKTIGFDIKPEAIEKFKKNIDINGELAEKDFLAATYLEFTSDPKGISEADYIIIAVPTPIDNAKHPDLSPLIGASRIAGKNIKKGTIVIFESTVFPGATEDVCVPVLEHESGFTWKKDFNVGYSPERINPGDKERTLTKIVKVVAGDTSETLREVSALYASIVEAGVYEVKSIKEAEAAKVIENTQRDLNIALVNELSIIFDKLDIDCLNVLEAASTKWNFLPFRPGLVGGHCIGVDPYYLTWKAESVGYNPQVILSGRRINDSMGKFIAEKTVKMMLRGGVEIKGTKVGVLGLTFKENCPDLRNSRVIDVIEELNSYGIETVVHDPLVDKKQAEDYSGISVSELTEFHDLGGLILAVPHSEYKDIAVQQLVDSLKAGGCLIDVKCMLDVDEVEKTGCNYWRL